MRPTASSTGDLLGLAEERLARRHRDLVAQRRRRRDDRRGRARLAQALDDLVDVARQPPQRGRRTRRGRPRTRPSPASAARRGRRTSGAARRRSRSRCGRCRGRRARSAAGRSRRRPSARSATRRPARCRRSSGASRARRRSPRASRAAAARRAARAGGARRRARRISSDDGLVERSSRSARATAPVSIRPLVADVQHRALRQRAGDLVRAREHRVGALRQRGRRQLVVEAEVRAPRLVDHERHAGARARPPRSPATSAAMP